MERTGVVGSTQLQLNVWFLFIYVDGLLATAYAASLQATYSTSTNYSGSVHCTVPVPTIVVSKDQWVELEQGGRRSSNTNTVQYTTHKQQTQNKKIGPLTILFCLK